MKKKIKIGLILLVFIAFSSFAAHKFYVSIYQINYNQKKQMLEITSRIFIDDMNAVLKQNNKIKTNISEKNESLEDVELMKKYLLEHFTIKINGKLKTINYVNKEIETNVIICYYNVKNVSEIKTLEVQNNALFDLNSDQQNIIQTTIYGKKRSLLLTTDKIKGILNIE
jgi:hypothetical protein